jgi:cation diffusion facilitator family transporter
MISDAIHTMSDLATTVIVIVGVAICNKEEDDTHLYGHERLECIASLLLAVILMVTGIEIGKAGIELLFSGEYENIKTPGVFALVVAIISILVKEGMYWYTIKAAKKIKSDALKADAWHHRSDALSSIGSFIGIGLAMIGFPIMDPIASLVICLFILKVAYDISRDALDKMLDTSCDKGFEENLRTFIEDQPGVEHIDLLHTRQFGNKIYIDLEIAVQRDISLVEAHEIAESVHNNVENKYPNVKHIMIHVNPVE